MGFLDSFGDGVSVMSGGGGLTRPSTRKRHSSHKKKKRSRSRSRSSSRNRGGGGVYSSSAAALGAGLSSFFGNDSNYHKHSSSRASFFGLADDRNRSRGSFFGSSALTPFSLSLSLPISKKGTSPMKLSHAPVLTWS